MIEYFLGLSIVGVEIHLLEDGLRAVGGLGGRNLIKGQSGVVRRNVQDVLLIRSLHEVGLGLGVSKTAGCTGADVEGGREVVA